MICFFSLACFLSPPSNHNRSGKPNPCQLYLSPFSSQPLLLRMGRLFLITLEGNIYSCKHCHSHLALCDDIISKSFHCRHGKAYLFEKVVNVTAGEKEDRMMMTGMHTVVDIFCVGCGSIVGWKYEAAHEKSQKYKEGKFILERFKVLGPDGSQYLFGQEGQIGIIDADDV